MLDDLPRLPRHAFLSYSKADHVFAEALHATAEDAGVSLWMDNKDIEPGTPDWERNVRAAVADAYALVLICSPNTVSSQYVPAELKLARKHRVTVVAVWVSGDDWIDCIPLELVNHHYIDCRGERVESGTRQLMERLVEARARHVPRLSMVSTNEACPPGFTRVLIARDSQQRLDVHAAGEAVTRNMFGHPLPDTLGVIAVNNSAFECFEELLECLYTTCLRDRYSPYTYGRDWVLVKASTYVALLALPWEWLRHQRSLRLIDAVEGYRARMTPLHAYGIGATTPKAGGTWAIVDGGFERGCGLFTSDRDVLAQAFAAFTKGLSFTLDRCWVPHPAPSNPGEIPTGVYPLEDVNPDAYDFKLVTIPFGFGIQGTLPETPVVVINKMPTR